MLIALLPLGILVFAQTESALEQVSETTLQGIGGASLQAAQDQIELIKEAQISTRLLAALLTGRVIDRATCATWVEAAAASLPKATMVAYIPVSGQMSCSSTGGAHDFSGDPRFQALLASPDPQILYNPRGPVSGVAIIGVSHPVFDQAAALRGVVTISLPYQLVAPKNYDDAVGLWQPTDQATVTADGTVLVSSFVEGPVNLVLPAQVDLSRLDRWVGQPIRFRVKDETRILSVVRVTQDLFALSVWTRDPDGFLTWASASAPYLLPGLTWLAALIAASVASNRLVVRHVRLLARSMSDYVTTQSRLHIPELADAPTEIRRLRSAYAQLVRTIELEEAEMQNLLVDKDKLLREVNHRSGNSLQIIASIMRLYRQETTDPDLRMVLDGLINRVIALSSTHTSLYALSGQSEANLEEIMTTVIARLSDIHGVAIAVTTQDLSPVSVKAGVAIPLALALAEAVSCYFTLPDLADNQVQVALADSPGEIRLSVTGPVVPDLVVEQRTGPAALPLRMLRQFAAQFAGQVTVTPRDGQLVVTVLVPMTGPATPA